MKSFILKKTNLFFFLILVLLSTFATQAQVSINPTGTPPAAGSMLDVSSTNSGVLIPRVAYSSISSLTVQGLLVYVTSGGPAGNGFYFYDSGWKKLLADVPLSIAEGGTGTTTAFTPGSVVFAGTGGVYTQDNTHLFWDDANDRLGIGTATPMTSIHVGRSTASIIPAILVSQVGTGDASFRYYLNHNSISSITTGIDDNDNHNFKISNSINLTGNTYPDANTMMRIHTETGSVGITDINHQSRARAYLDVPQTIPQTTWTGIEFAASSYDEHVEFSPGSTNIPGKFVAKEEGYYQVNARTEFGVDDQSQIVGQGYVSIAIFKNGVAYAVGNNLQMTLMGSTVGGAGEIEMLEKNNAPNVSDVLYLAVGDYVEIYVFQTFANPNAILRVSDNTLPPPTPPPGPLSPAVTYVSIHKVS
jgi:hypothetical protein